MNRSRRRNRASSRQAEALEERALLATFDVTNTLDDGDGSFRRAVEDANGAVGPDDIRFLLPADSVITLASEVTIDEDLLINGLSVASGERVTIDGPAVERSLYVDGTDGVTVTLNDLNMTGGLSTDGGQLFADNFSTVNVNRTSWSGGSCGFRRFNQRYAGRHQHL